MAIERSRHIINHETYHVPESVTTYWLFYDREGTQPLPGSPFVSRKPALDIEYQSEYKTCHDYVGKRTEFHPCSITSTTTRVTPKQSRPTKVVPLHSSGSYYGYDSRIEETTNPRDYNDKPSIEPAKQEAYRGLAYSDWNRMMTTAAQLDGTQSMNEVLAEIAEFPRTVSDLAKQVRSVAGASFGAAGLLQAAIDLLVCLSDWKNITDLYMRRAKCELKRTMTYRTPDGNGFCKYICKYRIYPSMFLTPGCGALIEYLGLTTWGIHDLINLIPKAQLFIEPFIRYSRLDNWFHLTTTPYEISCNWQVVHGYKRKIYLENDFCFTVIDSKSLGRYVPLGNEPYTVADDWIGPSLRNWENLGLIKLPTIK